jgi:hypothetical protein
MYFVLIILYEYFLVLEQIVLSFHYFLWGNSL